ncbi:MAG: hypothetical protein ACI9CA_000131 [Natronomonas sp.]|jgi:hypothetical protein
MLNRFSSLDQVTQLQYGLMFAFGSVCILSALSPLGQTPRAVLASVAFGITAGLWVSHLTTVLYGAADGVK